MSIFETERDGTKVPLNPLDIVQHAEPLTILPPSAHSPVNNGTEKHPEPAETLSFGVTEQQPGPSLSTYQLLLFPAYRSSQHADWITR